MTLGEKLRDFKNKVVSKLNPADAAIMEEGTAGLIIRSGWSPKIFCSN